MIIMATVIGGVVVLVAMGVVQSPNMKFQETGKNAAEDASCDFLKAENRYAEADDQGCDLDVCSRGSVAAACYDTYPDRPCMVEPPPNLQCVSP
jgi:hypothetical protein